jgi:hypothetical protein
LVSPDLAGAARAETWAAAIWTKTDEDRPKSITEPVLSAVSAFLSNVADQTKNTGAKPPPSVLKLVVCP